MLIDLSEILSLEGKTQVIEAPVSMDSFQSKLGSFPVKDKEPGFQPAAPSLLRPGGRVLLPITAFAPIICDLRGFVNRFPKEKEGKPRGLPSLQRSFSLKRTAGRRPLSRAPGGAAPTAP